MQRHFSCEVLNFHSCPCASFRCMPVSRWLSFYFPFRSPGAPVAPNSSSHSASCRSKRILQFQLFPTATTTSTEYLDDGRSGGWRSSDNPAPAPPPSATTATATAATTAAATAAEFFSLSVLRQVLCCPLDVGAPRGVPHRGSALRVQTLRAKVFAPGLGH